MQAVLTTNLLTYCYYIHEYTKKIDAFRLNFSKVLPPCLSKSDPLSQKEAHGRSCRRPHV